MIALHAVIIDRDRKSATRVLPPHIQNIERVPLARGLGIEILPETIVVNAQLEFLPLRLAEVHIDLGHDFLQMDF